MARSRSLIKNTAAALCALLFVASLPKPVLLAQEQPHVGQPGRDVLWVPTAEPLVARMLTLAKVTAQDYVIDLGSGDGRLVVAAAKRGARALGIEYNPELVKMAQNKAAEEGVSDKVAFVQADLFQADLSQATVLTMFLLPELNLKLRPRLLQLKPGTRIVSNTFTMGEWLADETAAAGDGCSKWCTALLWVVPARVAGIWRWSDSKSDRNLVLRQEFQLLSGELKAGSTTSHITGGILRGDQIRFSVDQTRYIGRVNGNVITGSLYEKGSERKWQATRRRTADGGSN